MTEQEALEAFFAEWDRQANEYGASLTREQRDCAEEAWNAALAWLRSQGEPVAYLAPEGYDDDPVPVFLAPQPAIPDGWQPIETMPKDGTPVDIWRSAYRGERCPNMRRVDLGNGNVFYEAMSSGPSCVRDATHWMPIPAAPEPSK